MSQIPKHMQIKRAQGRVLVKRNHFIRNYPEIKSYKPRKYFTLYAATFDWMWNWCHYLTVPVCKKLQNNNNSLAKALSKQKQESQLLFSENVALIAEVQDLGVACNKRDVSIAVREIKECCTDLLKFLF